MELGEDERQVLEALVAGGSRSVRRVKHAQILLAAAVPSVKREQAIAALEMARDTVLARARTA